MKIKKFKTVFSRYAEIDLIENLDYYQDMNPINTQKILDRIEKRVEDLKEFPERAQLNRHFERRCCNRAALYGTVSVNSQ